MNKARAKLHRDQRGAIAVAGVFMATFMAAALWYVVGLGDAAVHRERVQDANDSSAYASSVYHARGMNIISMGNVVMAAEFAVDLSVDISKILDKIELGILIVKCFTPPWTDCAFISPSAILQQLLDQLLDKLEQMIMKQLNFLSLTQIKIAQLVPFLGQTRAIMNLRDYYKEFVDLGTAISLSMVPEGDRDGMPVQDDDEEVLCEKARQVVPLTALRPLLEEALPPYAAAFLMGVTFAVTGTACSGNDSDKRPKRIFDEAKNGDKYFQVYGFGLRLRDFLKKRGDKGVDLAAWGKAEAAKAAAALNGKPFDLMRAGMAQTEFYYDEVGKWEDYKDDALWNLKWRSRIRRYREVPSEILGYAPLDIAGQLNGYLKSIIH